MKNLGKMMQQAQQLQANMARMQEEMAALGKSLPGLCEENPEKARKELVRYLLALTDQAIDWYFERPMALLLSCGRYMPSYRRRNCSS